MPITWNPADNYGPVISHLPLGYATLGAAPYNDNWVYGGRATEGHSTGKKFFEIQLYGIAKGTRLGLADLSAAITGDPSTVLGGAGLSGHYHYLFDFSNSKFVVGDTEVISVPQVQNEGRVGFAVDFDARKIWVSVNSAWVLNGNPATGANPTYTSPTSLGTLYPAMLYNFNPFVSTSYVSLRTLAGTFNYFTVIPAGFDPWDVTATAISAKSPMGNVAALVDVFRGKVRASAISPMYMPMVACTQTYPSARVARLSAYISGGEDGVADYPIPLSSFNLSKRSGATSYYSINVPFTDALLAEIVARPNGKIYIRRDGFPWESFNVGHPVRYAIGPRNASISISGTRQSTLVSPSTVAVDSRIAIDKSINSDGLLVLVLVPGFVDPRPGDTITWDGESYTVQLKKFQANAGGQTLSINAEPVA
jgi:hypothetical protein